jgi:hypothetical protein
VNILEVLAAVAVVVMVIGRQLRGEPLRGKRLIVLPAVLAVIGFVNLTGNGKHPTATDIACLVVSAVISAAIGLGQGSVMRLESRNGSLWGQLPVRGLWFWAALVVSRLAMTGIAYGLHAHVAASTSTILLMLGVNRLAQAAVVSTRAMGSGIPFAPEKDGSTFLSDRFPQR